MPADAGDKMPISPMTEAEVAKRLSQKTEDDEMEGKFEDGEKPEKSSKSKVAWLAARLETERKRKKGENRS